LTAVLDSLLFFCIRFQRLYFLSDTSWFMLQSCMRKSVMWLWLV